MLHTYKYQDHTRLLGSRDATEAVWSTESGLDKMKRSKQLCLRTSIMSNGSKSGANQVSGGSLVVMFQYVDADVACPIPPGCKDWPEKTAVS